MRHKYKYHVDEDTCIEVKLKASDTDSDLRLESSYNRKDLALMKHFYHTPNLIELHKKFNDVGPFIIPILEINQIKEKLNKLPKVINQ